MHDVHDVTPAAADGNHRVDRAAVEQRPDPVAVARQQSRQHGDEFGGDGLLAHQRRSEIHRGAEVDEEPPRDLALLVVLADVRNLQARSDIPVDVANIVVILVFAQIGQVEAGAAEQRPIVAVQQAIKTADDRPLQPPQDVFRRPR